MQVAAEFVSVTAPQGLYPAGGAFSIVLVVGVILAPLLLVLYSTGKAPSFVRGFDSVSNSYQLVSSR